MFHYEDHLETRENLIRYFTRYLQMELTKVNPAFRFIRIESPVLLADDKSAIRPTTVYGAYSAAKELVDAKGSKTKLPMVVWEHGKVFEINKRHVTEFYVLEYHLLFSKTTGIKYMPVVLRSWKTMLRKQCGKIFTADEDDSGITIFCHETDTELVRIRERDDYPGGKNIEMVCNLDVCAKANIQFEFGKIRRAPALDKK
jgi:hypothetical protein